MKQKKRSLLENIISLIIVQGADYLIPLLVIPYLLRVLGAEGYGKIAFVQAISAYFVLFTDYGFNWTGNRKVAVQYADSKQVNQLFWNIQSVKLLLFLLSVDVALALVLNIPQLAVYGQLMLIGLLPVLGTVLYPLWFLQGIEKMREAASIMLIVRFSMLAAILIYVKSANDVYLAAFILMGATPVAGIIALLYLIFSGHLKWMRPSWQRMAHELCESWHAFLAVASSSLYRSSNAVVLGFIAGPVAVAYYSLAEKLVKAVQEISRPLTQATYPRICALVASSKQEAMDLLRKLLLGISLLNLVSSLMLYVFAAEIIHLIAGSKMDGAITTLQYMSFIPLIGGINSVLGVQTMHPFGHAKAFSQFVMTAGLINIVLIIPLTMQFAAQGAALCYMASELILLIRLLWFHQKININLFKLSRRVAST